MLESWKLPISTLVLVATMLFGVMMSYQAARKGGFARITEVQAAEATNKSVTLSEGRFLIGEVIAPTADAEAHFVKIEVEILYQGNIESLIEQKKHEIKEKISQMITRQNFMRLKEDFADGFLQMDLLKSVNAVLGRTEDAERAKKVTVSTFLVQ
jgi:flagellar basal body-associated protein FliL